MKAVFGRRIIAFQPGFSSGFQHAVRAVDVRVDEGVRTVYRAVDMRFGRKVRDPVELLVDQDSCHECLVFNVAVDEVKAGMFGKLYQVGLIAGISQGVQNNDSLFRVLVHPVVSKICADEAGAEYGLALGAQGRAVP